MLNNESIKMLAYQKRVPQWEIAKALGVAEMTVYRWLRTELPDERYQAMLRAINEIAEGRENAYD